ncbi:MAG: NADP-dependent malic enzyme [Candidatus Norongarragalinales archaeon]
MFLVIYLDSLKMHARLRGKLELKSRVNVETMRDLALAYTPGVAEPCRVIAKQPEKVFDLTNKWNSVAVVSDGSRVLGLGDIGPEAALPVMEGKAVLFKEFAGVDAFPICIKAETTEEIVAVVKAIAPSFGGINLEDIASPKCFEVEAKLSCELDLPVFHDDQHGTAVVALAALLNALKLARKNLATAKIVVNGVGAAGTAIIKLLVKSGAENIIAVDKNGVLWTGKKGMPPHHQEIARLTNKKKVKGALGDVVRSADVFIGVSAPRVLTPSMVRLMNERAIVFALANPVPEIEPRLAKQAGAFIVATGRSDYENQVNNVLCFPGFFRGMLDCRARRVNDEMKLAAAKAIAGVLTRKELSRRLILPKPFDKRVVPKVAKAVARVARKTGVARK